MIKECELWLGKYPMLFSDDLNEWVDNAIEKNQLQPHDVVRVSMNEATDISALINYELSDDDSWMSPRKVTVLKGLESLKSAQIADLFDHLESSDVEHHIALTQASGAILKRVEKSLTKKKVRDYKIPEKPDAAASWGRSWLKERNVPVSQNALKELAEYAGEEQSQFASVLSALSTVKTTKELNWDDVRRHSGDIGAVKVFDITNAIARGDKDGAVRSIQRMGTTHPLQLLKMLEKRYRGYLALLGGGGEDIAAIVGVSTNKFALDSMKRESKKLGEERSIKSLQIVLETQRGIKGDDSLSADDAMMIMAIKLTDHFSRQK